MNSPQLEVVKLEIIVEEMDQTTHPSSVKRCILSSSIQTAVESTSEHYKYPDLISALPDSLLLNILSLLEMHQVMKTSLLSRRWRYLWKSIPCLCFPPYDFEGIDITYFIDRCLFHHEGSKICKLRINFDYEEDKHALLVDSWVHFAIRRKVEDFELDLFGGGLLDDCIYDEHYRLPRSLYSCTTLTSLTLCGCNLNLPADSFQLGSLEKLSLQRLELSSDSIEHLSSSCPLLEEIYLIDCNKDRDLINIVITNEHVMRLEISWYCQCEFGIVMINAPTLHSLRIYNCNPTIRFLVEELGSLMSADMSGDEAFLDFYEHEYLDEPGRNYLEDLLHDLRHVKHLKLCRCCIQVLSVTKAFKVGSLSIAATDVELETSLEKWELPGISYLLKNCPNLENLKLNMYGGGYFAIQLSDKFIHEYDFEEQGYWESVGIGSPSILQNIKVIKIDGYRYVHFNDSFVRFLLKNSKVLEWISISRHRYFNIHLDNLEKLFELKQRLIVLPRTSPNSKMFIT